tara:strand:+ start:354 stop:791 length:438 start_codon:yes stop_codon:yes gene_type:complete
MGFKLGKNRGFEATSGEIKTKMRFGKQAGNSSTSIPGTPVIRTELPDGVWGEANMDGSIYINNKIPEGSYEERKVVSHEMRHATDIKIGKLAYEDDHVTYNGKKFPRMDIEGIDSILFEGEWKEAGDPSFPWEIDANNGNKNGHI